MIIVLILILGGILAGIGLVTMFRLGTNAGMCLVMAAIVIIAFLSYREHNRWFVLDIGLFLGSIIGAKIDKYFRAQEPPDTRPFDPEQWE